MSRPISTVQLGVARFFAEVSDRVSDSELATWVRSFARSLAFQKPELNEYGAELMHDVEAYRQAESLRKSARFQKFPAESGGIRVNPADSEHSQSVKQSVSQSDSKTIRTQGANSRPRFAAPTLDQVSEYCLERKNQVQPQAFIDFYASKGWVVGRSPMKDWKAAVRTWEKNNFGKGTQNATNRTNRDERRHADAERLLHDLTGAA